MKEPSIIHVVSRRNDCDPETQERCARAFESWNWLYKVGGVIPMHVWKITRDATDIKDTRKLPFLQDVLNVGLASSESYFDVVLFTNDDVILHPLVVSEIQRHMAFYHAGSMRRVDVDTRKNEVNRVVMPPLYSHPISFVELGFPHLGRDAFVFHAGWLKEYWSLIPDFILGAPCWDICIAALIRFIRGYRNLALNSFYDSFHDCELPDGLVIHEAHDSKWMQGKNWESRPANLHNRKLYEEWRKRFWPSISLEAVDKQKWSDKVLFRYPRQWDRNVIKIEDIAKAI